MVFKVTVSISISSMLLPLKSALTAHRARETVEMLSCDTLDFIPPLQISYHLCNGLQTALISSRWTMQSGVSCRSASTAHKSVMSTTLLSDSWKWRSGPDLTVSLVLQLLNNELVCVCVWRQTEDLLNTFMTIDEWSHCFFGDNWTCGPCCQENLFLTCNWKHN